VHKHTPTDGRHHHEEPSDYITIEPASPQVVYVLQYNPAAVWVSPVYRYPAMYYPSGLGLMTRACTGCPVFEVLAVGNRKLAAEAAENGFSIAA
jgi:Protein of unknown function (DUF3300)